MKAAKTRTQQLATGVIALLFATVGCAKPTYIAGGAAPSGVLTGAGTSCDAHFEKSGECVTIAWEKRPTESDYGSFVFKTYRLNLADQTPIVEDLSGEMSVRLFMPSMGHGSSPVAVTKIDSGTYRASNVFFSMHGDWQIYFELKTDNKVNDKAVVPVRF
jgi:hypothetical protein